MFTVPQKQNKCMPMRKLPARFLFFSTTTLLLLFDFVSGKQFQDEEKLTARWLAARVKSRFPRQMARFLFHPRPESRKPWEEEPVVSSLLFCTRSRTSSCFSAAFVAPHLSCRMTCGIKFIENKEFVTVAADRFVACRP